MNQQIVREIRDMRRQWRRSDDEYRAHPLTICLGWLESSEGRAPCFNVAAGKDTLCNRCRSAAAKRRRAS